jgi:hypothetical protein
MMALFKLHISLRLGIQDTHVSQRTNAGLTVYKASPPVYYPRNYGLLAAGR